jgi:hypothetical protein
MLAGQSHVDSGGFRVMPTEQMPAPSEITLARVKLTFCWLPNPLGAHVKGCNFCLLLSLDKEKRKD